MVIFLGTKVEHIMEQLFKISPKKEIRSMKTNFDKVNYIKIIVEKSFLKSIRQPTDLIGIQ